MVLGLDIFQSTGKAKGCARLNSQPCAALAMRTWQLPVATLGVHIKRGIDIDVDIYIQIHRYGWLSTLWSLFGSFVEYSP